MLDRQGKLSLSTIPDDCQAKCRQSCPATVLCRIGQSSASSKVVQESRILQVCLFETIQHNLGSIDFSLVLPDIMLIADEVDSQLTQSVESFLKLQRTIAA